MTNNAPSTIRAGPGIKSLLKRILASAGIILLGALAIILLLGLLPISTQ
jgi:hypothetical protein